MAPRGMHICKKPSKVTIFYLHPLTPLLPSSPSQTPAPARRAALPAPAASRRTPPPCSLAGGGAWERHRRPSCAPSLALSAAGGRTGRSTRRLHASAPASRPISSASAWPRRRRVTATAGGRPLLASSYGRGHIRRCRGSQPQVQGSWRRRRSRGRRCGSVAARAWGHGGGRGSTVAHNAGLGSMAVRGA